MKLGCSSLSWQTQDGKHILGRTCDMFALLEQVFLGIHVIPSLHAPHSAGLGNQLANAPLARKVTRLLAFLLLLALDIGQDAKSSEDTTEKQTARKRVVEHCYLLSSFMLR